MTIVVSDTDKTSMRKDKMFGEIWLCSFFNISINFIMIQNSC